MYSRHVLGSPRGEHEILFDDVVTWANNLRKEIGSERVELEIGKDEVHVWQWLDTMDAEKRQRFLRKEEKPDGGFESIDDIGNAIGQRLLKMRKC